MTCTRPLPICLPNGGGQLTVLGLEGVNRLTARATPLNPTGAAHLEPPGADSGGSVHGGADRTVPAGYPGGDPHDYRLRGGRSPTASVVGLNATLQCPGNVGSRPAL